MKNRFDLQGSFIGLSLIFILLTSSCATENWDFIGTWNNQPDKLTYINSDQHIKLTFPNDRWVVYTKPTKPNEHFKQMWKNPWAEDTSYMVLLAFHPNWPGHEVLMSLVIAPVLGHNPWIEGNIGLEKYLGFMVKMYAKEGKPKYEVFQRKGRKIGVMLLGAMLGGKGEKMARKIALYVFFEEKERFSTLFFLCDEDKFESTQNQLWAIVDSYEYIE